MNPVILALKKKPLRVYELFDQRLRATLNQNQHKINIFLNLCKSNKRVLPFLVSEIATRRGLLDMRKKNQRIERLRR